MTKLETVAATVCLNARPEFGCVDRGKPPFCKRCTDAAAAAVTVLSVPNQAMITAGCSDIPYPLRDAGRFGVSRVWQLMANAVLAGS